MSRTFDHTTYLSPFSWRYGSRRMRAVWSEEHNRKLWRRLWVALAEAEQRLGLVTQAQVDDLRQHAEAIDIARSLATEAEIQHDVMAEIRTFADQCPVGGGIIHLGATSMDIKDNADALRLREALTLLIARLAPLLEALADQIERWADVSTIGFTHLQPAEPTTVGYRLAQYGLDLLIDYRELEQRRDRIRGKGVSRRGRDLGVLPRAGANPRSHRRVRALPDRSDRAGPLSGGDANLPAQTGLAGPHRVGRRCGIALQTRL